MGEGWADDKVGSEAVRGRSRWVMDGQVKKVGVKVRLCDDYLCGLGRKKLFAQALREPFPQDCWLKHMHHSGSSKLYNLQQLGITMQAPTS